MHLVLNAGFRIYKNQSFFQDGPEGSPFNFSISTPDELIKTGLRKFQSECVLVFLHPAQKSEQLPESPSW